MDMEHESGECLLVALVTDLPPEIGMLLFGFLVAVTESIQRRRYGG
jgi:hypothetical protein